MLRFLNNRKGFTLIELIMVIVILGILAAVAVPKFIDLQGQSRSSVADGISGALRGAITMLHAQLLVNQSTYDATTVVGNVDVSGASINNGAAVITATIDGSVFTWTYTDSASDTTPAIIAGPNGP